MLLAYCSHRPAVRVQTTCQRWHGPTRHCALRLARLASLDTLLLDRASVGTLLAAEAALVTHRSQRRHTAGRSRRRIVVGLLRRERLLQLL
ncbi:hypothetical protein AKJ09_01668 [Labilithrix luteola]|uniref:Uncharacterized protein n=1 Tax=Labilithrix luteola TaxID=1391654 RepID=A0A0K1PPF6_9BACT|nr:hypothetical protein AKJ09_01668 [Labilithrix luteola]